MLRVAADAECLPGTEKREARSAGHSRTTSPWRDDHVTRGRQGWAEDFPIREEVEDHAGRRRAFVINCHEGGLGFTVRAEEEGRGVPTAPRSWPGPPPPVGRPSPAMPAEHGVRLDDEERVAPFGKPPTDENPEPAVTVTEPWAWRPALQHDQLLTQAKILDDQVRSGFRPRCDRSPCPPDHVEPSPSVLDPLGVFHRAGQKERTVDRVLAPYSGYSAPSVEM
jgi:hypothetical protein